MLIPLTFTLYRSAGFGNFRKKLVSSGKNGRKWKKGISSSFFWKKVEEMEETGRIRTVKCACTLSVHVETSSQILWSNTRTLKLICIFQNSENLQGSIDLLFNLFLFDLKISCQAYVYVQAALLLQYQRYNAFFSSQMIFLDNSCLKTFINSSQLFWKGTDH